MCGSPSSSGRPSSSGSSGRSAPLRPPRRPARLDLRRFAIVFLLAYVLGGALWMLASPAYERLLGTAATAVLRRLEPGVARHVVTRVDRTFYVHLWAKIPESGVAIDARSTHFNWLILLPLLAATRALGRGVPGPAGALAAAIALAGCHLLFLVGAGEYRALRMEGGWPRLQELLRFFTYFYYAVGRIGLAVLIWMPLGLEALRRAPAGGGPAGPGAS